MVTQVIRLSHQTGGGYSYETASNLSPPIVTADGATGPNNCVNDRSWTVTTATAVPELSAEVICSK